MLPELNEHTEGGAWRDERRLATLLGAMSEAACTCVSVTAADVAYEAGSGGAGRGASRDVGEIPGAPHGIRDDRGAVPPECPDRLSDTWRRW